MGSAQGGEVDRCAFCGRPCPDSAGELCLEGGEQVCSSGCQSLYNTLGALADGPPPAIPGPEKGSTGIPEGEPTRGIDEAKPVDTDPAVDGEPSVEGTTGQVDTQESTASIELEPEAESTRNEEGEVHPHADPESHPEPIQTFLRVDGMHAVTCEQYLESVACEQDGVFDAEASYVTESIRVDHDPAQLPKSDLEDALSRLGYTAYLRDTVTESSKTDENTVRRVVGPENRPNPNESTSTTRRAREMSGIRKRRSDDAMDMRYILSVVFGSFLLIPYITVLYPAHLAELYPAGPLEGFTVLFTDGGVLFSRVYFVLTGIVLYFAGMPVLRGAYISLKLRQPNTDLLAALAIVSAYLYSSLAVVVGNSGHIYYDFVLAIAAIVTGGILYESSVKQKALDRLTELTVSQVDSAHRLADDGSTETVDVGELEPDDRILVKQGERIPVDGELAEGSCTVDEAIITGESVPIIKEPGDDVVGGSIVTTDAAIVRVGPTAKSSIDRLTTTVWQLQSATHGVQRRADRLAGRLLTPIVGFAVLGGVGTLVLSGSVGTAILSFLAVFMIASPWLLGFATPLSIATTLEEALERGIVIFDETVFERLRAVDTVVFDKTGTLTRGQMTVLSADAPQPLLEAAGRLEQRAAHPAADAIARAYGPGTTDANTTASDGNPPQSDGGEPRSESVAIEDVSGFRSYSNGVSGTVDGDEILVGHPDLFIDQGWELEDDLERQVKAERGAGRLPVVVGQNGRARGLVVVGDQPRANWENTIKRLSTRGMNVIVLTGDERAATEPFASHPDVSRVFAGVPPEGKVAAMRKLGTDSTVAMVGDGTNDAPALAEAALGISLGGGTDLASDASDITVAEDDLTAIETAFDLAEGAHQRVEQNNRLAFVYNGIAIPVALLGVLNPLFIIGATAIGAGALGINSMRSLLE
ncbi:cation-translocating P-type ATPase [Halobacteria archaeon AArc-curdl1]|uniref:Cation-translocating P-type ATPase n=1 Tax=Natronosalvus hydrolyticus TaxID=2979988 RepID=A0AAP3E6B0_9EURY|nr:cation-translocating P-type ATPase [Halobacteria archaeon AArc-curdl1]